MPDSWKGHEGSYGVREVHGSFPLPAMCLFVRFGSRQTCGSRATLEPWSMDTNLAWQLYPSHAAAMPLRYVTVHKNYGKSRMKMIKDASRITLGLAQVC